MTRRIDRSLLALLVVVTFAGLVGCKPPPSRLPRGGYGYGTDYGSGDAVTNTSRATATNTTGSNTTGSNTTGSNITGSNVTMPPVPDDLPPLAGNFPDDQVAVADDSAPPPEETVSDSPKADTPKEDEPQEKTKLLEVDPLDWPYWRGPHYNGISYETGLVDDWDPAGGEGSNVLWKRDDIGTRSTPIVMRGKLYLLMRDQHGTAAEGEKVICLDAATGETLWENSFNVWLSDVPDTRVGWSSVVGDPTTGRVYALGVCGYFQCIDGETGKTLWDRPLHEEFGLLSTYGGRTNFPIVIDDLVIISGVVIGWGEHAKPTHQFFGFDKLTGEVVWLSGTRPLPDDTTYGGPSLAVINGTKQLVFGSGDGAVWGFQPRTGVPIWKYQLSERGLNVAPFVVGNRVFTGQSEEVFNPGPIPKMGSVVALEIDSRKSEIKRDDVPWQVDELMCGKSSPLVIDDRVYAFEDGGTLLVLDAKSGEEIELDRSLLRKVKFRNMRGSPLFADGKIYAVGEAGQWAIFKPHKENAIEIVAESGRTKKVADTNASPIASHGRIYIATSEGLYCLEDKSKSHAEAKAPPQPQETPVGENPEAKHLQLVPAEALVRPGEKLKFAARLFNAKGQFLKEVDYPQFSLEGGGSITPSGKFTAPADAQQAAIYVNATSDGISARARLRVIPDLPWEFTFDEIPLNGKQGDVNVGEPPIAWVGMRYRHVIREKDGNKVMVKVTTIPKGTRSRGWIGRPDLHDYTMEADVMGAVADDQLPEIGLIVQGYCLALQGNAQMLQARTWVTQERLSLYEKNIADDGSSKCKIPFKWEANKWYRMKLRVQNEEKEVRVLGKVWPKGEQEPVEWTIECLDPAPQRQGAPGFYGDANFAEIYIDNVKVYSNEEKTAKVD